MIGVTGRYVQGIGAAALIARFSLPLAVLLLVATFGVRRVIHRANAAQAGAFDDHVPTYRRAGYYTGLATVPLPSKEFEFSAWPSGSSVAIARRGRR